MLNLHARSQKRLLFSASLFALFIALLLYVRHCSTFRTNACLRLPLIDPVRQLWISQSPSLTIFLLVGTLIALTSAAAAFYLARRTQGLGRTAWWLALLLFGAWPLLFPTVILRGYGTYQLPEVLGLAPDYELIWLTQPQGSEAFFREMKARGDAPATACRYTLYGWDEAGRFYFGSTCAPQRYGVYALADGRLDSIDTLPATLTGARLSAYEGEGEAYFGRLAHIIDFDQWPRYTLGIHSDLIASADGRWAVMEIRSLGQTAYDLVWLTLQP